MTDSDTSFRFDGRSCSRVAMSGDEYASPRTTVGEDIEVRYWRLAYEDRSVYTKEYKS